MADRYFVEPPITGDHAQLVGPEAHHLTHVMRAQSGHRVTLFDGSGSEFAARVKDIARSAVELTIESRKQVDRELPVRVTIAVALPKGERQRWLVEKLTELGVFRLVPLITDRAVAQPVESALARLRRGVIEASKQCGRNRLMEIAPPQAWQHFVESAPADSSRFIAHPNFATAILFSDGAQTVRKKIHFAVGPEGGLTQPEIDVALAAGWQTIDLGPRILRVETAAIALAAAIATHIQHST
jgi:16S rRNA (uracil1498-N3)-methyltransferase